jgi:hypothetical protein
MDPKEYAFLDDEAPEDVAAEAAPEPVAETVAETPPEAPATPVTTTAGTTAETPVPYAAMKAERDKRQAIEARARELERRLAEVEQRQPTPTFYENPEAHVQATEQRLQGRFYAALEAQAKEVYPDFDEVVEELAEQAQGNPLIREQVFSAANPAIAAYKLGQQMRELKAMKDPAAYRASLKAEIVAELAREAEAKESARRAAESAIPPELSAARSSKDAEVVPDDSLDSILASKKR